MPFRYNGEGRLIRPLSDLPIDVLGGGYAVAPPSIGRYRRYEFLRGGLDDFASLPFARVPKYAMRMANRVGDTPTPLRALKQDHRNDQLFRVLLRHTKACDGYDPLFDVAITLNADMFDPPLDTAEIAKIVASAWQYEVDGRNWVGRARDNAQITIRQNPCSPEWEPCPPAVYEAALCSLELRRIRSVGEIYVEGAGYSRMGASALPQCPSDPSGDRLSRCGSRRRPRRTRSPFVLLLKDPLTKGYGSRTQYNRNTSSSRPFLATGCL